MSNHDPHRRPTMPRRRPDIPQADPGQTVPHPTIRRGSSDVTQPHRPVYDDRHSQYPITPLPPPPPPRRPPRLRRRPGLGCLVTLFKIGLAGTLFVLLFTMLFAGLYVIAPPPRTNILILGVDARPGEGMITRTDTIILATVDPDQPYVGMLSIPRDLYVEIPGYGENRINAAHVLGESEQEGYGIDLAAQTVEQNFGVRVHRTLRLNFDGFVAIIDAAGGVTIDVPESFTDYEYPTPDYGTMTVSFDAGVQHMSGERALQYARIRHGSSDFVRAARQQQVIAALVRQLLHPANWWRIPGVYVAFVQNVETDLTLIDAALLAPAVLWVGPDNMDRQVITQDIAPNATLANGAEVQMPDWSEVDALIDRMLRR